MTHAGRSVIISGSTVAIGLLSMILLPLPFIRSIGIGGMLIPAVSVLASITLLPALLSLLGPRINRLRVMPKRFVNPPSAEAGFWARWARLVTRRPLPVFLSGAVIVDARRPPRVPHQPERRQAEERAGERAMPGPAAGRATGGHPRRRLPAAHHGRRERDARGAAEIAEEWPSRPGIAGAAAPPRGGRAASGLVEAFGTRTGTRARRKTVSNLRHDVLPAPSSQAGGRTRKLTLGGMPAESRDFISAVYGNFPYVLSSSSS